MLGQDETRASLVQISLAQFEAASLSGEGVEEPPAFWGGRQGAATIAILADLPRRAARFE